jgi:hypothetical protein
MWFVVAWTIVVLGLGGCSARTYTSNLAFDVTQRAYVTDRPVQAVVVSHTVDARHRPCSGLVVC